MGWSCTKYAYRCNCEGKRSVEVIGTSRRRGKPKKNIQTVTKYFKAVNLAIKLLYFWIKWKSRIHLAGPSLLDFRTYDDGNPIS